MAYSPSLCLRLFSSRPPRSRRVQDNDLPSSPRVGCMGQVQLCGSAEEAARALPPHSGGRRSGFVAATSAFLDSPVNGGRRAKTARAVHRGRRVAAMATEEMDPPLPVTGRKEKGAPPPPVSLWKRRCRSRKLDQLLFCQLELKIYVNSVVATSTSFKRNTNP